MYRVKVTFNMQSFWHAGSGYSRGALLDSTVIKTPDGLPYLPGRTVKGLFREAVTILESYQKNVEKGTIRQLFGSAVNLKSENRYSTSPGSLRFSNAALDPAMVNWFNDGHDQAKEFLFDEFASTKINKNGLAEDHTLRNVEVAVPVTLTGYIESDLDSEGWADLMARASSLIRYLGTNRHRGLGRTIVTVEEMVHA